MLRSKASRLFSLVVLCGGFVFSQSVSSHGQPAKFSSLYTDLKTECKAAIKLKRGENPEGQDMPLKCKGYGGYEVRIDYSAASSSLRVQPLGKSDQSITLGMQPLDYDQKRKIEWRLANGKPFAVIYRVVKAVTDAGVEIIHSTDSNITISILVPAAQSHAAEQALHDTFRLGRGAVAR